MYEFVRPHTLSYPTIYHTFEARDLNSNKLVRYRVQDFPRDRYEEGIQFMIQYFFEHEVMGRTRRIKTDRLAVSEISRIWREFLGKGLSVACFKENSDDIIAMNLLDVSSVQNPQKFPIPKSQNLVDMFGVLNYAQEQFNVFDHYNVTEYLQAYGLCVDTVYRGRGIATEMLKARGMVLRALGLKVTTAAYSGAGSQAAAFTAGFEENFIISYDELYKTSPDYYFPGIKTTHFKIMSLVLRE